MNETPCASDLLQCALRVAAYSVDSESIILDATFPPRSTVSLGTESINSLVLPAEFPLRSHTIITDGVRLHLATGMRVNMCGDGGEPHVIATYDELRAMGVDFPLNVIAAKLTVTLAPRWQLFMRYVPASEGV